MKKVNLVRTFASLIDLKEMKTLLTARLHMTVSSVPTWFSAYVKKFRQEAHSYRQADICSAPHSDHDDTRTHIHTHDKSFGGGGAPRASYDKRRHRNCFQTRPLQAFPNRRTSPGSRRELIPSPAYTDPKRSSLRGQSSRRNYTGGWGEFQS